MKLKTKLQITAGLPVLVALVIAFVLIDIQARMGNVTLRQRAADEIAMTVFRLNNATYSYKTAPSIKTREDWQEHHTDLTALLKREAAQETGDRLTFKTLGTYNTQIRDTFRQLIEQNESEGAPPAQGAPGLFDQLLAASQSMVSESMQLASVARIEAAGIQNVAYRVIIASSAALAGILALLALFISRSVSESVSQLQEGTRLVASGNLQHQIRELGSDEMSDLAKAFNAMTRDLSSARTASEKAAEELRQTNRELSDALVRLKRAQSDVVQQERMQALRQIARGIVHDMNDALTPILGISDVMKSNPECLDNRDDAVESLSAIYESAGRATKVVRFLSDFFRPTQDGETTAVDLGELIQNVIDSTEPLWKGDKEASGVRIQVTTDIADMPAIQANENELREALTNLVINAIDAIAGEGTITIKAGTKEKKVVIEVIDTGIGMTAEVVDRCREPFFSTKEKPHSGMGLTAAWGVVQRCHGSLEVSSDAGKGTTVTITLPLEHAAQAEAAGTSDQPAPEGLHVLTIDDEIWTATALQRLLAADGHTAESAMNGKDGIEQFKAGKFDLVIVDRAMPDIRGDEVAAEIRKLDKDVRVIMLSGFGDIMMMEGDRPEGVDIILSKPISHDDLREAITRVTQPRK